MDPAYRGARKSGSLHGSNIVVFYRNERWHGLTARCRAPAGRRPSSQVVPGNHAAGSTAREPEYGSGVPGPRCTAGHLRMAESRRPGRNRCITSFRSAIRAQRHPFRRCGSSAAVARRRPVPSARYPSGMPNASRNNARVWQVPITRRAHFMDESHWGTTDDDCVADPMPAR